MSRPVLYLKRAYLFMRKALDERLKRHQLTTSQFEILGYLYRSSPMEQQMLQHRSGITAATLTGILDKLEARGLLQRIPNQSDARTKQVTLTPRGTALFAELIDLLHGFEESMLKGFSVAEKALLTDWLERIVLNLGDPDQGL